MDITALETEYGDSLCLWGHIDTQDTYSAHDTAFLKAFSTSMNSLSTRNSIIIGTNCGLYEGIDIERLRAIYQSFK